MPKPPSENAYLSRQSAVNSGIHLKFAREERIAYNKPDFPPGIARNCKCPHSRDERDRRSEGRPSKLI